MRSGLARELDARSDPLGELPRATDAAYLSGQVVLVGYGAVGQQVAAALEAAGMPFIIVEEDREVVESLRQRGYKAVLGDAREPLTLVQAHTATARLLVVAVADPTLGATALRNAKRLSADLPVLVRTETADEAARLLEAGAEGAVDPRRAIGAVLAQEALQRLDPVA